MSPLLSFPAYPLREFIHSAMNQPELLSRSLQPESREKRRKGGRMGNADPTDRKTARLLHNLTEFIAGEKQSVGRNQGQPANVAR
jgi:hypothetical protein